MHRHRCKCRPDAQSNKFSMMRAPREASLLFHPFCVILVIYEWPSQFSNAGSTYRCWTCAGRLSTKHWKAQICESAFLKLLINNARSLNCSKFSQKNLACGLQTLISLQEDRGRLRNLHLLFHRGFYRNPFSVHAAGYFKKLGNQVTSPTLHPIPTLHLSPTQHLFPSSPTQHLL